MDSLKSIVSDIVQSKDPQLWVTYARRACMLLDPKQNLPIEDISESGIVPHLLRFLRAVEPDALRFEAACAITYITCGSLAHKAMVVEAGALPAIRRLLHLPHLETHISAVFALGNLAIFCSKQRDHDIMSLEIVKQIIRLIDETKSVHLISMAIRTMSILCRDVDKIRPFEVVSRCLPMFCQLLHNEDGTVIYLACKAVSDLTDTIYVDDDEDFAEAIFGLDVVTSLGNALVKMRHRVMAVAPAMHAIANILRLWHKQGTLEMKARMLVVMPTLLAKYAECLLSDALSIISSIAFGGTDHINLIISAGLLPFIKSALDKESSECRMEAVRAIYHIALRTDNQQLDKLVKGGFLGSLYKLLNKIEDEEIITMILHCFCNVLEAADEDALKNKTTMKMTDAFMTFIERGAMDSIQYLFIHKNEGVRTAAFDFYRAAKCHIVAPVDSAS